MNLQRLVAVVTVGRSDYGVYRPILAAMGARADVRFGLIVSGEHLPATRRGTMAAIHQDGYPVLDTVEMLLASDSPEAVALSMGLGMIGFVHAYDRCRPDLILLLGDRFEMFAAGAAAVPLGIPIAHVHGGELTEGAMDERFRHALTKLSHLHFASSSIAADRIRQMGEESWRITVAGAPGLDSARAQRPLPRDQLFAALGIADPGSYLLVTYHPVTTMPDPEGRCIDRALSAIDASGFAAILTTANADPGSRVINDRIRQCAANRPERFFVFENLGHHYGSAMAHAAAMVGNSSSGVIEACSFDLPVVNIGERQDGRDRSANLIDCPCETGAILEAIRCAVTPEMREVARHARNVYGDGCAGPRIAERLATVPLDDRLRIKRFSQIRLEP